MEITLPAETAQFLEIPLPPEPTGFAEFWQASYREALAIPLNIARRQIPSPRPSLDLFEVEFDSLDGVRIGGWITVPKEGPIRRGIVIGHGYGGRDSADFDPPGPTAVTIAPCARGFNRSAHPKIPNQGATHVVHGIGRKETYSHRGSAADLWCAASVLLTLFPEAAAQLDYMGGSFGGGIGALAIPWDHRFHKAYLDVPSFGNHPVRLKTPCTGSGESVRRLYAKKPQITDVLEYFDSATAASHFQIPVLVAAALSDPAVPPAGQFAVYKAIPEDKELFVRSTGHPDNPKESIALYKRLDEWFA